MNRAKELRGVLWPKKYLYIIYIDVEREKMTENTKSKNIENETTKNIYGHTPSSKERPTSPAPPRRATHIRFHLLYDTCPQGTRTSDTRTRRSRRTC